MLSPGSSGTGALLWGYLQIVIIVVQSVPSLQPISLFASEKKCLLVDKGKGRKGHPSHETFFQENALSLPITTETCARFREILKAGVKEFGEVRMFGRNVWTEGRLRSYVWLKFPAR